MTALLIFEDESVERFLPLVWTRPIFELLFGTSTVRRALEQAYGLQAQALLVRPFLRDVVQRRTGLLVNETPPGDGMVLLLNGRIIPGPALPEVMPMCG